MAVYTHSVLASDQAVAADGQQVFDLPVRPLSLILIKLAPLNETSTIGNYRLLEGLLSALDTVRVLFRGAEVFNASGVDAVALALLWHRFHIWQSNAVETDNDRRALVVPICFGRKPFVAAECFPSVKKGELQLLCTWDIADTGFDGLRISIETIELPAATPDFVQRVTTLTRTSPATGVNELDLPIGEVLRAVLLFGTTGFAGAAPAPSWADVQLLVGNQQQYISSTDWEVLRCVLGVKGVLFPPELRHIHSVNAAGAGREDTLEPEIGASIDDNYALIDLDPTWDDAFALNTEGASRVHLRYTADTADVVRALPIERVPTSRFLEAP